MHRPLQIGITGGIGAGKSLVCRIFHCLGIPVYDADGHAKELMTTDVILMSNIRKEFGELSFNADGTLNRNYLSKEVFSDAGKLAKLNKLVHPRVGADYSRWVKKHEDYPYVIKEAALLFEAGSDELLDKVIVVYAPETLRIKRVLARDPHRNEDQIRAIMNKQMPEDQKMERADLVLANDERDLLVPRVIELHNQFLSMAQTSLPRVSNNS